MLAVSEFDHRNQVMVVVLGNLLDSTTSDDGA